MHRSLATPAPTPRLTLVPFVGPTLSYIRSPLAMMRDQYDRHGPVSDMPFLGQRWSMLMGPDACAEALLNRDKAFSNQLGWNHLVGPFFHRGLMLLDFDEHLHHRRLMQEAFSRDRLHGYVDRLNPGIARGLDGWQSGAGFAAYPALKKLTLDLATDIFMGGADLADAAEFDRVNRAFIDCVQAATGFIRKPLPGTRWGRATKGRAFLDEFFGRHVAAKRESDGSDLFSVLARVSDADGMAFTDADIVNHMIFVLMAAHDTSTITVSTMMRFLGQHPEWQEQCRHESLELGENPGFDELAGLTSLDLVMKESLRLVPPVPVLARRTVADTEVMGVPIPKGRLTAIMLHLQHHMPEYWSEPERFDPERFAEPRREDTNHRHAWAPFGGGVHKCLGMHFAGAEIRAIMHHLLRRFRWSVPADYETPLNYHSLPFPDDGQPVDLTPLSGARTCRI